MSRRRVGLAAAVVGVVAAGTAAGVALERRAVGRARNAPDPYADEPFGALHTAGRTVYADDGVPLHVEIEGDDNAPLTIVFVHGFTLSMDCWHFQRRDLDDVGRLVFYDQRSHGASGRSARKHATIDQLGRDLGTVLAAVAPRGPVVLVGHSMGGMTLLALADQHPEINEFGLEDARPAQRHEMARDGIGPARGGHHVSDQAARGVTGRNVGDHHVAIAVDDRQ